MDKDSLRPEAKMWLRNAHKTKEKNDTDRRHLEIGIRSATFVAWQILVFHILKL